MKKKKKNINKIEQPSDFIEPISSATTAILSGIKLFYEHNKDKRIAFNVKEPLNISVLSTRTIIKKHELIIKVENLGKHGVYLEKVSVIEPRKLQSEVYKHNVGHEFTPWDEPQGLNLGGKPSFDIQPLSNENPFFVPSQNNVCLRVLIQEFPVDKFKRKPHGKLKCQFMIAGIDQASTSIEIEFAVRK